MNNDKVLRASRIGHLCDRNLWYSVNGAEEITNEKSKRIFELGKILEPVIINWLRNDGWKVRRNPIDESNKPLPLSSTFLIRSSKSFSARNFTPIFFPAFYKPVTDKHLSVNIDKTP